MASCFIDEYNLLIINNFNSETFVMFLLSDLNIPVNLGAQLLLVVGFLLISVKISVVSGQGVVITLQTYRAERKKSSHGQYSVVCNMRKHGD